MEFKKQRGSWRDVENLGYRITKTKTRGIPRRFYACVRTVDKRWEFAWHRRGYKTLAKAVEACEFNRKIWAAFIALGEASGNRKSRLDTLDRRGRRGLGNVLLYLPLWARPQADPKLLRMISPYSKVASREEEDECTSDQNDPDKTSPSTQTTKAARTTSKRTTGKSTIKRPKPTKRKPKSTPQA